MKPHRVSGYRARRYGKGVSVSGYTRGGRGSKGSLKKAASRKRPKAASNPFGIKSYNPKTGPSEAEKRRNAAIMFGSGGGRKKAKKRKR
jgi:hypothetical protein